MSTLYQDSLDVASAAQLLSGPLGRRDRELARRLKRATSEVPEHVVEGMCSVGRQRKREYGAALGSAREALACLSAAESVGYLSDGDESLRGRVQSLVERIHQTLAA